MQDYFKFLERKRHSTQKHGIKPIWIPDKMFDFQKYAAEYAIEKGRCAIFFDTGLGKTLLELVIAVNYAKHTNKPVLIITPLAVAFQFIREAEKFGIDDIEYSKFGEYSKKIVVCNYERLQYFNPDDFDCVILDESSILKNFEGAIKTQVTAFMRKVKYRFVATATPSPNDYVELGTSSEALGEMGYMDMLKTFFANNENNIRPQEIGSKWYLKPHAKDNFFQWVSGWSISMRKPSDLGFDDSKHILPKLIENFHPVKNESNWVVNGQIMMFNIVAQTLSEVKTEQQMTTKQRCEKAVELTQKKDFSVYWTNFNVEGKLIEEMDSSAVQIHGSMDLDKKEDILLSFSKGEISRLITKPRITAFGLNWQHCAHTVFFPTFSYEQYYQSIRRFWRFGQTREVTVDLVYSDGQKRVLDALLQKTEKAIELFDKLNTNLNGSFGTNKKTFEKQHTLPSFLKH